MADLAIKKLFPTIAASSPQALEVTNLGKNLPLAHRRFAWRHFHLGCAYVDPVTRHRCGEKHGLQVDHIRERARGGSHATENLQLLCPAHNRYKSRDLPRGHPPA